VLSKIVTLGPFRAWIRGRAQIVGSSLVRLTSLISVALLLWSMSLVAFQNRGIPGIIEDDDDAGPTLSASGVNQKTAEWTFARFHYDMNSGWGGYRGFQRWAADYPKADRQFVRGVRRLTRIQARPVEQVVDAKNDDLYNWPWIYVENAGAWQMSEAQAARLREYLNRGGFMMIDDSHGDYEWENFLAGMQMIYPGRSIEDLGNDDALLHVVYDLGDRFQVPGTRYIWNGRRYTADSAVPKWRAIRDDKGRIVVAICHNSDVGDAWEWADSPNYPENAASLAYRIGVNYIIYAMTH
jgi:hypothetical protein